MATLTIPKTFAAKDDIVVLPRKEYETLVRSAKANIGKAKPTKKLPSWLRASLKEDADGKAVGPFHSVDELMKDLRS